MLSRRNITYNLKKLDKLFSEAIKRPKTYREANFYAKMAVLESCSWLETYIDRIFEDVYLNELKVQGNLTDYKRILEKNYGFHYKDNIREKLSKNLIGMIHIERIEGKLNKKQKFNNMKGALGNLKSVRNEYAHDHISGAAFTVQTVSLTINNFNQAYEGLKLFEKELKRISFN